MATELEGLATEAEGIGAPVPGEQGQDGQPGGAMAPAVVVDPNEANRNALCMLLALLREATATPILWNPPLRTLAERLPDERLPALADPWARVLTHYGVDLGRFGGDHPLMIAAVTTGPALWGIASALRAELAERNRAARSQAVAATAGG